MNLENMKIRALVMMSSAFVLFTLQSLGQDTTARNLQEWLDFLGQDSRLSAVIDRIGGADKEKSVNKVAPNAESYVWYNRFKNGTTTNGNLELVVAPEQRTNGSEMVVVAIMDGRHHKGIYLPWAWRFVDYVPSGNRIPNNVLKELAVD